MTVLGKQIPAAGQEQVSMAADAWPKHAGAGQGAGIWPSVPTFWSEKRRADTGSGRAETSRRTGEVLAFEDFDRAPAPPEPEVIAPTFSLAEVEAARAEAFRDGRNAAAADAQDADHATIRRTLGEIATQLAAAREMLAEQAEQSATAVAQLLLHSLGAVMPHLARHYGEAELKALIRAILPGLVQEPAATVRLNPLHAAGIAHEIEHCDPDLAARLRIVPTETIPPGDLRIAWCNGGAARDTAALWSQVAETLGLAGLAPAAATETAAVTETRELEHAG